MKIVSFVFAFLFGTAIGSFLNVLIYRIPRRISIIHPGSSCPRCRRPIEWYENIPIVSFLALRGRCRGCHQPISIHYPLVELLTGILFLVLFLRHGLRFEFFFYIYFFCALIVISGIDFTHQIIPDLFSMSGIAVGLLFQILEGNFLAGLIGMVFGGGLILLIRVIGGRVYKKEVMGMGDVYLTAMIGSFVGFPVIIPAIFLGALTGAVLGIIFIVSTQQSRESPIPFGPFLSIGGVLVVLFHTHVIRFFAYLGVYLQQ